MKPAPVRNLLKPQVVAHRTNASALIRAQGLSTLRLVAYSVLPVIAFGLGHCSGFQAGSEAGTRQERLRAQKLASQSSLAEPSESVTSASSSAPAEQGVISPSTFNGQGTTTTDRVFLPQGLIGVKARANGDGNFILKLIPVSGEAEDEHLLNEIVEGGFSRDYQTTVRVKRAGDFVLQVEGDTSWSLALYEP